MFIKTIQHCNLNLQTMPCCNPSENNNCDCYNNLQSGFYNQSDMYDCPKKMNYYTLNYGASYISEYYHFLVNSTFTQQCLRHKNSVNIKSLGCGFAPDFYAFEKYIDDNKLNCQIDYTGYDASPNWATTRPILNNLKFVMNDITKMMDLSDADIIVLGKVFSTVKNKHQEHMFLQTLRNSIASTMQDNAILIFNDINHWNMGRDLFHESISPLFREHNQFCFEGYRDSRWTEIVERNIIYDIPNNLRVQPKPDTCQTVVFEYRK